MRRLLVNWLHLACLWTLAVCLPVFEVLSKSPDWLIAEHADFPALPLVSALFVLGPPTAGIAVEAAVLRADERAGRLVHLAAVACLVAAYTLQLLKDQFDPERRSLVFAALVVGAAFAWLYRRGRLLPGVLTLLSPATAVVLVWFLAFSDVAPRAWGNSAPDVDAPRVADPAPVVLVVFDEFSSLELMDARERIDAARFPNFAALAREATWYRSATAAADATIEAVPSIFTGRVTRDAQPVEEDHPQNLFRLLDGQYAYHVHEPLTYMCTACDTSGVASRARSLAASLWTLTKQRLRPGDPADFLGIPQRAIRDRDDVVRKWIGGIRGGRMLNVLHVQFPHTPWWYTPDGRQYSDRVAIPELSGERWTRDQRVVDGYLRRYVDQVRFVDRLVGELRADLVRRGIWDRALVTLVADHGVAFVAGSSRRFVDLANVAEIASVPLFVKLPGQRRGRTSDELAQTIDVMPTIGDVLGADWEAQGQSLRRPVTRDAISVSRFFDDPVRVGREPLRRLRRAAMERLRRALGAR